MLLIGQRYDTLVLLKLGSGSLYWNCKLGNLEKNIIVRFISIVYLVAIVMAIV